MRNTTSLLLVSILAFACSGTDGPTSADQDVAESATEASSDESASAPESDSASAETNTDPSESATAFEIEPLDPSLPAPQYDVFLAAVAVAVEGTRFKEAPFDDPEVFAATGLLICERLRDGAQSDDVVFDYLTELTEGDPSNADDDQLALAGALMGAATEALCPDQTLEQS